MNKRINNLAFIILSLLLHLAIIVFLLAIKGDSGENKRFYVYGAHSKKPTFAFFKSTQNLLKTNWFQKKLDAQKRIRFKKLEAKRKRDKNKVKPKPRPKVSKSKPVVKKQLAPKAPAPIKPKPLKNAPQKRPPDKKIVGGKRGPDKKILDAKTQNNNTKSKVASSETEELHFNTLRSSDPKLFAYQKDIQKEVERLWRPPIGVPKGTECSVLFTIDRQGKVSEFNVVKPSNILIYDLSILRISGRFKFDKFFWGKKLTIDFIQ